MGTLYNYDHPKMSFISLFEIGSKALTIPPSFNILLIISIAEDSLISEVLGLNDKPSIAIVFPFTRFFNNALSFENILFFWYMNIFYSYISI